MAKGKYGRKKLEAVMSKTGGKCWYCGIDLTEPLKIGGNSNLLSSDATIDHITPKSKDGDSSIDNLVPCCRRCNSLKGTRNLDALRVILVHGEGRLRSNQIAYLEFLGIDLKCYHDAIEEFQFYGERGGD